jgi:hypothetical protein
VRITNPYRQAPLWAAGTDPQRLDIGERHSYAMAQSSPTRHVLASGPVNSGQVKVELVTPTGKPPFAVVTWPLKPSAMSPAAYSDGLTPWSAFVDITETVPELAWPNSIHTYSAMRTDAQIASLLLAFTLPIRRYRWYIAPSGAGDEVVEDVANDFNSPIKDKIRSRSPDAGIASVTTATCSTHC